MKTKTFLTTCFLTATMLNAQTYEWAKSFGAGIYDQGHSVTVDALGNVYTTGYFQGTTDFNPGAGTANLTSAGLNDIFIQKLDAAGNFVWAKSFGSSSDDAGLSITIDAAGNVYSTGYFQATIDFDPGAGTTNLTSSGDTDVFVLKLDASGSFVWAKSYGGSVNDQGSSITLDASGNIYSTGYFQGASDFDPGAGTVNLTSAGNTDIFVQKLDASGNFVWANSFGASINDQGSSIIVDASGNVYSTGYFRGTADFDPGAGTVNLTSVGNGDVFIQKLDASGNFVWAKSFGSISADAGQSITVDPSGNVYTTGSFQWTVDFDPGPGTANLTSVGNGDVFVQKLDATGNFVWAKSFGASLYDIGYSITSDLSGNIYSTGHFSGTVDFDPGAGTVNRTSVGASDVFVQKLDAAGNFIWAKSFGGSSSAIAQSITVDVLGNIYTTGLFFGTVDFNPGIGTANLTSVGNQDVFVHKMSLCTPNTGIHTITGCDSYTWIDGNTYTASNNTATFTLTNVADCDSVVTLNLTMNQSSVGTSVITACDSYTWIDGNTYTASNNTATFTLTNAAGCDSVLTLNLTIKNSTTGTHIITACDSYTWIDGNTYTTSNNTATFTLTNAIGCDSVVTLNLTINTVSDISTSTNGLTISANNTGATYQWLDCDNNYAEISGEMGQSFTAISNGSYTVELSENGCIDTSTCIAITTVGILENSFGNELVVYPNPTSGNFSIDLGAIYENAKISIYDVTGNLIDSKTVSQSQTLNLSIKELTGIYIVSIQAENKKAVIRLLKE